MLRTSCKVRSTLNFTECHRSQGTQHLVQSREGSTVQGLFANLVSHLNLYQDPLNIHLGHLQEVLALTTTKCLSHPAVLD